MIIYFSMIALSVIFALYCVKLEKTYVIKLDKAAKIVTIKQSHIFAFLSFLPLFIIMAFRDFVGVDYNTYAWIFKALNEKLEKTHTEPGYNLLNLIIGHFTNDFIYLFIITSLIILVFFYIGIEQNSCNVPMSLFLFCGLGYYFYAMNSIRHFMALAIYFYAIKYMKKNQFIPFLICIMFAASFHKVALVAIPIYFIFTQKFKISYYMIISVFLAIAFVFNKQIMSLLFRFVYSSYQNSVYNVFTISWFNIIVCGLCTVLCLLYYKPLLERNKANIIYINAAILMFMFFVFCGWIPTLTRIGQYGTILFILLIPEVLECEKNKKVRTFYYAITILFILSFLFLMFKGADSPSINLLPYKSIFAR